MSTKTPTSDTDRRKHPRTDVYHPIRFKLFSPEVRLSAIDGDLQDISTGGARLLVDDPYGQLKPLILKGLRTKLEIALPESDPIQLLCDVSWVRAARSTKSGEIDIGLEFSDLHPGQLERIQAFMAVRHNDQTMFWSMWDAYQDEDRRQEDRRQVVRTLAELGRGERRHGDRRQ